MQNSGKEGPTQNLTCGKANSKQTVGRKKSTNDQASPQGNSTPQGENKIPETSHKWKRFLYLSDTEFKIATITTIRELEQYKENQKSGSEIEQKFTKSNECYEKHKEQKIEIKGIELQDVQRSYRR